MSARHFDSVLVANRGEVACRIIRSVRALGMRAIAVYSEADRQASHVALADEAVLIGPAPAAESYLSSGRVLDAARKTTAGGLHPGYGFLSENAAFARAVEAANLVFIGPPASAIEIMGDKAGAKRAMKAAGVRCVPGYEADEQSDARLIDAAEHIGFPVMVKAAGGGGGRGMRLVERAEDLTQALTRARGELLNAFGSHRLILERAIRRPRHVEIQVLADAYGAVVHLGERDCSVQRRHQKVIEEAPSPIMTGALREKMGGAAVEAARAVKYRGAGTVEFLLDAEGEFYFLEMNTRLQVEHPVTELTTDLDLVALQIRIAEGEPLPFHQVDVKFGGHAIEARLYAEDPAAGFLPSVGRVEVWRPASGEGVRIDAGISSGQTISPFYDPMLAKIIAHGETRDIARRRLIAAIESSVVLGVTTNSEFLIDMLRRPDFVAGAATTAFIDENYPQGFRRPAPDDREVAIAAALNLQIASNKALEASTLPDESLFGFNSAAPFASRLDLQSGEALYHVTALPTHQAWTISLCGERQHEVAIDNLTASEATVVYDGRRDNVVFHLGVDEVLSLAIGARRLEFRPHRPWENSGATVGSGRVAAPMPGVVVALMATAGQRVEAGETLAVLEAMKMQHVIAAPIGGVISEVFVAVGRQLALGAPILDIEEDPS